MPSTLMTPGVYVEEINAFPGSAVAVETAVPVFIGYTQKADRKGKSLNMVPTRVTSFAEYAELFGHGFNPTFTVAPATTAPAPPPPATGKGAANPAPAAPAANAGPTFTLNGKDYLLTPNNTLNFYSCIRMFYQNGGSKCFILSVGTYGDNATGVPVQISDFFGGNDPAKDIFKILEKEYEPTLVVIPDIISTPSDAYSLYLQVLLHCSKTQNRFGIFDVMQSDAKTPDEDIADFRLAIGTTALNYGAAYYPWLNTSVISASEIDFKNLDASVDLTAILPENPDKIKEVLATKVKSQADHDAKKATQTPQWLDADQRSIDTNYQQSLLSVSPSYKQLMDEIRSRLNLLPPSAAMAGIYTLIDSTRGVWKAPANVSLSAVNSPSLNISHDQQEQMNIDVIAGKSINVIRPFPGIGTLIWGARTLDGNSQDWRYINVRRTMIMIEQSLKLATRAYVFEPNDSGTWITLHSMMNNFLFNLWKQGALAGAVPEQAYEIQVGLGKTMTPTDILDGILRVSVKVAVVRPAEFIVITFQQLQQQS